MDLSKIPGKTPRNDAPGQSPPNPATSGNDRRAPDPSPSLPPGVIVSDVTSPPRPSYVPDSGGGEGYFSLAIGALLLMLYPRTIQWVSHKLFGTGFSPFMIGDREIPYPQVPEFLSDLGITLFAVAMVVEGLFLLVARRCAWALYLAGGVMVVAVALNAYVLITRFSGGLPVVSALAVIFGLYSAVNLFRRGAAVARVV